MASTEYDLKLKISADNQASKELDNVSKWVSKIEQQATKLQNWFSWWKNTEKTLKQIWITATAVAWSMALLWKSFISASIENEPLQRSFERLSQSAWIASDEMLKAMRKASKWTVADTQLMAQANKAYSLWIVSNVEDMSTIMEIARLKGQAMWRTMEEALDDIVTWLWRWSVQILDNLWIVIKQTEAQELYAQQLWKTVDQLTEAEKKQALVNAVVSQWKKELAEAWDVQETMQEKLARVNAQWENMKNTIGDALIPVVDKLLKAVTPIIEKVVGWIEKNPKLTATIFTVITAVAWLTAMISWLALALPWLTTAFTLLSWPIWRIIAWVTALWVARATNFWWIREKTQEVIDKISATVKPRIEKFQAWRSENWETVKEILRGLWDAIWNIFSAWLDIIGWILEWAFKTIDILMKVFSWDREWAWNWIVDLTKSTWETIQKVTEDLFWPLLDWIAEKLTSAWTWITKKVTAIKDSVIGIFTALRDALKLWFEFWIALFTWDWETVAEIWNTMAQNIDTALTNAFGTMRENIKWKFREWIDTVLGWVESFVGAIEWVVERIKNAWNSVKSAAQSVVSSAKSKYDSAVASLKSLVSWKKAGWWPVVMWNTYLVGEKWPELFVPNTSWKIIPNNEITNNNWITINISWVSVRNDNDIQELAKEMIRQVKLEKNFWIA